MKKIESFQVNHLNLLQGVYLSRKDFNGVCCATTFDLRITAPNREPVMDMPAIHTIEHLGATYFRLYSDIKDKVIYFGPMGCRTGFYLVVFEEYEPEKIFEHIIGLCDYIIEYEGEIPGARAEQCGNFSEQNLDMAKYYIKIYKKQLLDYHRTDYPQDGVGSII